MPWVSKRQLASQWPWATVIFVPLTPLFEEGGGRGELLFSLLYIGDPSIYSPKILENPNSRRSQFTKRP